MWIPVSTPHNILVFMSLPNREGGELKTLAVFFYKEIRTNVS